MCVAKVTDLPVLGIEGGTSFANFVAGATLVDGFIPGNVPAIGVSWTLALELIFYAMVFAFLGVSKTNPLKSTWLMIAVWVCLTIGFATIQPLPYAANSANVHLLGFLVLGKIIYLAHQKLVLPAQAATAAATVVAILLAFTEWKNAIRYPDGAGSLIYWSYLYAVLVFILALQLKPRRIARPFRLLGDVSYSLYLLHVYVGVSVLNLMLPLGLSTSVMCIIGILASVAAAVVSYRLVELPGQRLARRLLRPRSVS